ncbi:MULTISPECIES: RraA family protein [Klebsiella pneumoniae complex]|uniref:RraA family protein n=1 Tax=Klebsiella pneumoniae complex TaxID=3390273 RepID=UPI000D74CB1A|nr:MULTISPECIES: RraA family protein [Klebsiella]MCI7875961.1 RraA family protein [Klebsiella pneumoniae]MCI7906411.1 RraA family protein [Klebsiella pneumoniae]MCP3439289.1 RraA family protein [Klebsiella variicola]MCP5602162.1 RraA family protein [Klebsiella pneumoniae]PXM12525.1 dimethylmenaquinone methyltransferase [Klebsiella variicola]
MSMQDALLTSLLSVETATIGHMISHGFMSPQLQCVLPEMRVCGPALTVSLPEDDGFSLPLALKEARAGDILVIERLNDDRHACWGAVMTAAAQQAGIAAVILDGYITDLSAIISAQFPVWCKGRSPLTTKQGKTGGSVNKKINCAGVAINPGDIILADENGVLALSSEEISKLLDKALQIQSQEPLIIEKLKQGISLADIYGL